MTLDNAKITDHFNSLDVNVTECKYYDLEDIQNTQHAMLCMHINIHSIPAKFDRLKELVLSNIEKNAKIDVLLLCETFLNERNSSLYNIPGYNFVFKNRQKGTRGGVAMYISDQYTYKLREDLVEMHDGKFE
jgi:exonuclease III